MCKTAYSLKALQVRDAIARQAYRARHKLARLQAARRADGDATPPVEKDVGVSGVFRDEH